MEPEKHICGQCNKPFTSEQEYIAHMCETTGFTPADPRHLGEGFQQSSQGALARGNMRKELEAQGVDPEEAQKQATEKIGATPITK